VEDGVDDSGAPRRVALLEAAPALSAERLLVVWVARVVDTLHGGGERPSEQERCSVFTHMMDCVSLFGATVRRVAFQRHLAAFFTPVEPRGQPMGHIYPI
jgi:hypothetical protein